MTGAQLPETENVPGKTKKSRTSGASKAVRSSKAAGAARVSRKAKAAGASKKDKASRDSETPVKKNKLKAASVDKAHATKVKKVKKSRYYSGHLFRRSDILPFPFSSEVTDKWRGCKS